MRPVNLIPPEDRRGDSTPLRAGVASYVVLGVLAAALLAVVAVVLTGNSIKEKKAELSSLQARQQQAEAKAAELAPYAQFAADYTARQEAVKSLADSRFDWKRVLRELAIVTPNHVWLESITGTVAPGVTIGDGDSSSSDPSIVGPSLHIVGCGRTQKTVAAFLASMRDIDGVTRVGVVSSTLGDTEAGGDQGAASADTGDSLSTDCQTRPSVAKFDVTVAFDAVPASAFTPGTGAAAAVPATTPTEGTSTSTDGTATTPTTGTTSTTPGATTTPPATSTDGVGDATAEQQGAVDSAQTQTDKAKNGAANVGVGG